MLKEAPYHRRAYLPAEMSPESQKLMSRCQRGPKTDGHDDKASARWQEGHTWLVHDKEQGMFCTLCKQFNKIPRNRSGVWVSKGCMSFCYDKIKPHEQCASHKEAESDRAAKAASESSGGIQAALQETKSQQQRAVIGALKCVYFLTKIELSHTTTFSIDLGLLASLTPSWKCSLSIRPNNG